MGISTGLACKVVRVACCTAFEKPECGVYCPLHFGGTFWSKTHCLATSQLYWTKSLENPQGHTRATAWVSKEPQKGTAMQPKLGGQNTQQTAATLLRFGGQSARAAVGQCQTRLVALAADMAALRRLSFWISPAASQFLTCRRDRRRHFPKKYPMPSSPLQMRLCTVTRILGNRLRADLWRELCLQFRSFRPKGRITPSGADHLYRFHGDADVIQGASRIRCGTRSPRRLRIELATHTRDAYLGRMVNFFS